MSYVNKIIRLFSYFSEYNHIRKVYKKTADTKEFNRKCVVFNSVRIDSYTFATEVFMAAFLAKYGANVIVLIDDGVLEHHDTTQYSDGVKLSQLNNVKSVYEIFKSKYLLLLSNLAYSNSVTFIPYSNIINQADIHKVNLSTLSNDHKIDYYAIVESSVKRYFKSDQLDKTSPFFKKYYSMTETNAKISYLIGKYVTQNIKPNSFITSHGIYSTWGPCFEYVKTFNNIKSTVFAPNGYKKGEIIIHREKHQIPDKTPEIRKFMKKGMSTMMEKEVNEFFNQRLSKKSIDTSKYYENLQSYDKLEKIKKPIFIAFPNVVWEGDIAERNVIFSGLTNWLEETIIYFENNPESHLVVRFHPSETIYYSENDDKSFQNKTLPLETLLRNRIPHIDHIDNLTIIHSHEYVDSYRLIKENMAVGLLYRGMLALETVYLGKPLILCARGMYTNNGLAYEPKNKSEYFNLIKNSGITISNWDPILRKQQAMKLCWYYMFGVSKIFPPLFNKDPFFSTSFKSISTDDIESDKNTSFKEILHKMV
jgi:hypothetical protein